MVCKIIKVFYTDHFLYKYYKYIGEKKEKSAVHYGGGGGGGVCVCVCVGGGGGVHVV